MSKHQTYSHFRKITPGLKPDGTPDDNDRVEIGPTQLAFDEWAEAGIECPDLAAMRAFRHRRIVAEFSQRGGGLDRPVLAFIEKHRDCSAPARVPAG